MLGAIAASGPSSFAQEGISVGLKSSTKGKRAFAEASKAAHIGVREAQYELGLMYAHGMGVQQNLEEAVLWVRKAAERGLASAQYLLATRYASGAGVEQDEKQALWWFLNAAQQGHAKALLKLGKTFASVRPSLANAYITEAARMGLAEAQFTLAQECSSAEGAALDYTQAAYWYQLSAEQNFAPAQCALASLYMNGQGVARDIDEALFWYRQAVDSPSAQVALEYLQATAVEHTQKAGKRHRRSPSSEHPYDDGQRWESVFESGDADARYHLGLMYELGIGGVAHDAKKAQILYTLAAKQEDVRAQLALARMLEEMHDNAHLSWYHAAAKNGNAQAQCALGTKYTHGQKVEADPLSGLFWYCSAIKQDDALALTAVGDLCNGSLENVARACFQRLADKGDPYGQFMLGKHLANGKGGVKDLPMAFHWWQKAAEQGHAPSQCALGAIYLAGQIVEKSFPHAFLWFQRSAVQDDAQAQWNLGSLYASGGEGLNRDLRQAFAWCQRSADSGFVPAQATLGTLYMLIEDFTQAIFWWRKAAEQGDAEAQYNLATTLSKDSSKQDNLAQAFHWFFEAATQGLPQAQSKLGLLYVMGEGVAVDAIEAHKWFLLAATAGDLPAQENLQRSQTLLNPMQIAEATRRARLLSPMHKASN